MGYTMIHMERDAESNGTWRNSNHCEQDALSTHKGRGGFSRLAYSSSAKRALFAGFRPETLSSSLAGVAVLLRCAALFLRWYSLSLFFFC